MKMVHDARKSLPKDFSEEFEFPWVTSALDCSEYNLVFEKIYNLLGPEMIAFRQSLIQKESPKTLKLKNSLSRWNFLESFHLNDEFRPMKIAPYSLLCN